MKKISIYWCLCCLFFFMSTGQAAPAAVIVAPTAEINRQDVRLGDIAQVYGDDPAQVAALQGIILGRIFRPGDEITLSAQVLSLRARSSGVDCDGIDWQLPPSVVIRRQSQQLDKAVFERLTRQTIAEQMQQAGDKRRYTLDILNLPETMNVPTGTVTYEAMMPNSIKPAAVSSVQVTVLVDSEVYQKVNCRVRVHMYQDVLTAARPLLVKEVIAPADVQFASKEVNAYDAGSITSLEDAIGFVMAKTVKAGDVLLKAMLEQPILIEKGSSVHICAVVNGIQVQAAGVALQDGHKGGMIRVRNESSKKILRAKVKNSNTVEVAD